MGTGFAMMKMCLSIFEILVAASRVCFSFARSRQLLEKVSGRYNTASGKSKKVKGERQKEKR
jgi:hypothetical protein